MYRFDGVRLLPWTLAVDGKTINHIVSFYADHAGGLWALGEHEIFYQKGGVVTSHFALQGQYRTGNVSVDPDGSLWVLQIGYEIREPLCHITSQGVKCFGESDGLLLIPYGGESLLADGKGGFWLGGQRAVVHWHDGASEVYPIAALKSHIGDAVAALAFDPEGSLWVGILLEGPGRGLGRLEKGVFKPFVTPGFDGSKLAVFAMTRDRDGSLWVGTMGHGLFRIRGTSVEHYGQAEGLSGDDVQALYEDREGILWVTTTNGIDSFRDAAITTFSKSEGLANDEALGVLASRDGAIWVANKESLDHIDKDGAVSSIRWGRGLPGDQVSAMLEDRAGNLWMGVYDGLYLFKNGRFQRIPEPGQQPLGLVQSMTEDKDGNIWAVCSGESRKLIRIRDFQIREEFSTSQIPMGRIAPDPHGGIWIGPRSGGSLVLFRDGVQKSFATGSPANLSTNHLSVQADGSVLAAFDDGLVELRQGQVQRMTTKNGLPCNAVYSFIEDKEKRWWLLAECGVVELSDAELQRWWANPRPSCEPGFMTH